MHESTPGIDIYMDWYDFWGQSAVSLILWNFNSCNIFYAGCMGSLDTPQWRVEQRHPGYIGSLDTPQWREKERQHKPEIQFAMVFIGHWVPEQLNIKAVTGACELIDGCSSLELCSATSVSGIIWHICHRNKDNSIAWLYRDGLAIR